MSVTDRYVIREMNEKLVLTTIIHKEAISRAEISKQTHLNKATVSSIVGSLLANDLILELGIGQSSGGRKPIMVTFNNKAGISLSLDLGPDYISSMLTYLNGDVIRQKTELLAKTDQETRLSTLKALIEFHINQMPASTYGLIGICVGIHGIVKDNQLVFSPFYDFDHYDLKLELEQLFKVPVILENEANLSALGEKQSAPLSSNLISISVKNGIGAGIILNDSLFTGINGYAGEVGHLITVPNGKPCPCGNCGCLEQYTSEYQILKLYQKELQVSKMTFSQFKEDYQANHPLTRKCMEIFIQYITIGVNNLITIFNPEIIIINSKFTNQIDGVIDQIKANLNDKMNAQTQIKASTLHEKATLLGGAHVNSTRFLQIHN